MCEGTEGVTEVTMQSNFERKNMPLGSVMMDLEGTVLSEAEKKRLCHPSIGGVVLFARNFESVAQLQALTQTIAQLRHPRLLVAVDQEGGRVQRFREGFTQLPPMGWLGECYQRAPEQALALAQAVGWVMASECLAVGVDFSFAPVVDLDYGDSHVIGDRAFARDPATVSVLAQALVKGMRHAGMAAVAKHFPGHGYIQADTHHESAEDGRGLDAIYLQDMQPFLSLIQSGIAGVMPAHVRYPQVDASPAGFSEKWLKKILRRQCHFEGVVVSDDLSMHAAAQWGAAPERVAAAMQAGCDLVLLCNDPQAVEAVCQAHAPDSEPDPLIQARLARMYGVSDYDHQAWWCLHQDPRYQAEKHRIDSWMSARRQQSLI